MFISAPSSVRGYPPLLNEYQVNPITPSDSVDLATGPLGQEARGVQVAGAGNVAVNLFGGGTAVLTGLADGQRVICLCTRILATGTTATGVSALY